MDVYLPQGGNWNNTHPEAWKLPHLNSTFLGVILNCNCNLIIITIFINGTDDINTKEKKGSNMDIGIDDRVPVCTWGL